MLDETFIHGKVPGWRENYAIFVKWMHVTDHFSTTFVELWRRNVNTTSLQKYRTAALLNDFIVNAIYRKER